MKSDFESYEHLQDILKQVRSMSDPYGHLSDALKSIAQAGANLSGYIPDTDRMGIGGVLKEQYRLAGASQVASDAVSNYRRSMFGLESLQESQLFRQSASDDIIRDVDVWKKLVNPSGLFVQRIGQSRIDAALIAWDSSLYQLNRQLVSTDLLRQHSALASRLLSPSHAYTTFVEKTSHRLEENDNPMVTAALEVSLELAQEQLLTTTDALIEVVEMPDDVEEISPPRESNLLFSQQDELIALFETKGGNDGGLVCQLASAQIANDARCVLQLVNQCNELALVASQREIFKPTTRSLEVYTDLPWLVAQDRSKLADVVDCLYFLLYEGAGKDSLRFHQDSGGVLDGSDCAFIWQIKHFRNKWLSHDVNHGKEAAIIKSWATLKEELKQLGFNHVPCKEEHFIQLHQRMLQEAISFLTTLRDKLVAKGFAE